ncbi:MAG TPA: hypothetical protein VEF34_03125 [Syntrophobacteraceae bacterium]|nr:hypothetical protein [Syntrophobacteraceae bacterium]
MIYTGYLTSGTGHDPFTGLAIACIGFVLIVKPALEAAKYCSTHFGGGPPPHRPRTPQKLKTRKVNLKVVKSEDDKPTIH